MNESEMGNRGTKSKINQMLTFVKAQRVDGDCIGHPILRCTLMDFERSYQIINLSKVFSRKENRFYSTSPLNTQITLNPWFLTGFIDGEGSF